MRLTISAIGKAGKGPEAALTQKYFDRLPHQGKLMERDSSKPARTARIEDEGDKILSSIPSDAKLVVLDERGKSLSSRALAELIKQWRDDGIRDAVFAIGGADGHSPEVIKKADIILAFGEQTWPHLLVRAMLAEQLYRAEMILIGHPYHHG